MPEHPLSNKIVVRNSQLKDFRQCPLKEMFAWRLGWRKPAGSEGMEASDRGTQWHAILREHYEQIRFWRQNGEVRYGDIISHVRACIDDRYRSSDHYEILYWMYDGYIEKYGLDEDWEILHVEETHEVPFIEPDGSQSVFWYRWTSDLVVRDRSMRNRVRVLDNKSNKNLLKQGDIDLDDQYGNYAWAWRRLGLDVFEQAYNGARTEKLKREMVLSERFARVSGYRTDRELREIELDALRTAKAMYSAANLEMPYSAPDPRICGWKCDYENVHLAVRKLGMEKLPQILRAHGFEQPEKLP